MRCKSVHTQTARNKTTTGTFPNQTTIQTNLEQFPNKRKEIVVQGRISLFISQVKYMKYMKYMNMTSVIVVAFIRLTGHSGMQLIVFHRRRQLPRETLTRKKMFT